jgi:signal transduction histidine kinase
MAWTTSACVRAWPIFVDLADTQRRTAKFLFALLRRSASRWHPSFAFALPLAVLGFMTPLLPPGLTATLLTAAGAALAIISIRPADFGWGQSPRAYAVPRTWSSPPRNGLSREIAAQRSAQRHGGVAVSRPRIVPEPRDRNWGDLMARVNHDLRTPLNAVIGFSELMALELFGPLGDERYQDYAHHIRDSATDLLKSAEDTLALAALMASRGRRDEISACDLELLAADAWAFVSRKAAARDIAFEPCISPGLEVLGEPRTLRQILVNMLSEAVARASYGERVILTAVTEGELVELAISVTKERTWTSRKGGSLAICLARTLLEMQGTSLIEIESAGAGWRAVTVLDRAAQPDFFFDFFRPGVHKSMPALLS